jgi:hypothetical protein
MVSGPGHLDVEVSASVSLDRCEGGVNPLVLVGCDATYHDHQLPDAPPPKIRLRRQSLLRHHHYL